MGTMAETEITVAKQTGTTNGNGTQAHSSSTLRSYAPATGALIGEVPITSKEEVLAHLSG